MSNVIIDKNKIDILANAISCKSGEPVTMTLDEMVSAVDGIETGGGTPTLQTITKTYTPSTSAVTDTITASSGYDGIEEVDVTVSAVPTAGATTATWDDAYSTSGNQRKWRNNVQVTRPNSGWTQQGSTYYYSDYYNAVPANTTVTPTESSQTIGGADYMMEGAVTVNAIPSNYVGSGIRQRSSADLTASGRTVTAPAGYYGSDATKTLASGTAGTPTATKGTVSNHSVSVTPSVTNTTGYITGSTITGTPVTVSASELVSGTLSVTSSGTKDVTNYASASVPALTLPSEPSSTSSGTKKAEIGSSNTTTYLNIPSGYNDTAQHYLINSLSTVAPIDTLSVTTNGTYDPSDYDCYGFSSVTVNVSGGGSSTMTIGTKTATLSSASSSISFTGLSGNPLSFVVTSSTDQSTGSAIAVAVAYDGTSFHGMDVTTQAEADTGFTKSYSSGTLTITATSATFEANEYKLVYAYGGSSSDIHTADVQVGSGATSITFSSLSGRPLYFSCVFKSSFSTSSGYQRVIDVVNDGTNTYGHAFDSSAKAQTSWSYTYSGGNLTITSTGTNNGGYFHQPGYYQLTYAVDPNALNYQNKTGINPTTSSQTIYPDSGYDALESVQINAIPSSYVQPTTTVGATTYRASTSNQTINSGTYHSANATIAAVSQTNLEAGNIKSGTTISISNGQSNLWSVTGTYTGGGGGDSKNVQVLQSTSRTSNSSLTKVLGDLTVSKTGTYDVYWSGGRTNTSTSYTWGTRLYIDGTGYGTENTTWSNNCQSNHLSNVSLTANQKLSVYARGRTGSYYTFVPMLTIVEA